MKKDDHEGICLFCGKEIPFESISIGYRTYCSRECLYQDPKRKDELKEVLLKKYGVNCSFEIKEVKEKILTKNKHKKEERFYKLPQELQDFLTGKVIHYCQCGCGQAIIPKKHHERFGIPKYKTGHGISPKKGKTFEEYYGEERGESIRLKLSERQKGHIAWNKDLTVATDERMKRMEEKRRANRVYGVAWNKNLTKETDDRVAKLSESLLKISEYTSMRMSERNRLDWQRPEYISKQIKARHTFPNKIEMFLQEYLDKLFPNEYKYVGSGEIIISNRNPDFININGKKKIIELFGDYWHKEGEVQERINIFKKEGWETLIIWEHELKNLDKLKEKLVDFTLK